MMLKSLSSDATAIEYLLNTYGRSLVKLQNSDYTPKQKVEAEYKVRTGIDILLNRWEPPKSH